MFSGVICLACVVVKSGSSKGLDLLLSLVVKAAQGKVLESPKLGTCLNIAVNWGHMQACML